MKKNTLRKIILLSFVLSTSLLHINYSTYANDIPLDNSIVKNAMFFVDNSYKEDLNNGYYTETVISSEPFLLNNISLLSASKNITKTKTTYCKNSSGSVLWSVSIRATFTYNGSTSKCTRCSHSTTAPGRAWSIKSASSSKNGNTATVRAAVTHQSTNGTQNIITKYLTISCSPSGKVS